MSLPRVHLRTLLNAVAITAIALGAWTWLTRWAISHPYRALGSGPPRFICILKRPAQP